METTTTATDRIAADRIAALVRTVRRELCAIDFAGLDMGQRIDIGRQLDNIAFSAVSARGALEYGNGTRKANALTRRVRKALGYTYP